MVLRRAIQGASLALFLTALWGAPEALLSVWPADGFLRMDPIIFLGTAVAGRQFTPLLWIAGLVLLSGLVLGRFFCAWLCPMGTTIDLSDHLLRPRRNSGIRPVTGHKIHMPSRRVKTYLLSFIIGAGILGISFVFIASPLSLITRFYGLIIYPVLSFLAGLGLPALRFMADKMDMTALAYAVVKVPRYDLQWVTLGLVMAIFACGLQAPRFWCRYLCPSGALFSLFSFRPLVRRLVSPDCSRCGLCVKRCPMEAVGGRNTADGPDPFATKHSECIACQTCVAVCPTQAGGFGFGHQAAHGKSGSPPESISIRRRRILGAGLSGTVAAITTLTGLKSPHSAPGPGSIVHPAMIRPPGAVPENDFLALCVRCGECMHACPTNSLQPLGLEAGLSAFFSPVITPRRGPCEPRCTACGRVCPTGAIPFLPVAEKLNAKVGTARISRQKCLAWELEKKCLICDEVCPFDAVEFRKLPGMRIAVPFVAENKCGGCGFCEHHCPVRAAPAIVVEPMLALRLAGGSYRAAARERGYSLELVKKAGGIGAQYPGAEDNSPSRLDEGGLPPGFTDGS